jgi:hypothetical protein
MLKVGDKVLIEGIILFVDDADKNLPYQVKFSDDNIRPWLSSEVCKPLKVKVAARSASTNSSYASALRKRVGEYFPMASVSIVNSFIKSVQRLNASKAKHCA